MNAGKIVIDGKTYNSVDEMPDDVRRAYEEAMRAVGSTHAKTVNPLRAQNNIFADANNNGTPDIMENSQVIHLSGGMNLVVDGKSYHSVDELPPDARARYEQAMQSMDNNRNGLPDFLEGMMNVPDQATQPSISTTGYAATAPVYTSPAPMPASQNVAPDTSNGLMLAISALALLFLCAAAGIGMWYFFIR